MPLTRTSLILVLLSLCHHDFSTQSSAVVYAEDGNSKVTFDSFKHIGDSWNDRGKCHEHGAKQLPIIEAEAWSNIFSVIKTTRPVDYVVISHGGTDCKTRDSCQYSLYYAYMGNIKVFCFMSDNFYIGGSGDVFEARGWDVAPYKHLNGLRENSVTVKFLGDYRKKELSEAAKDAFKTFLKMGVWQGKLSERYKIVSIGQIYNDSGIDASNILKFTRTLKSWSEEVSLMPTWELVPQMRLSLVTREEWGAAESSKEQRKIWSSANYVLLSEGGGGCRTLEECSAELRTEQEVSGPAFGDVHHNFYISDDGHVYEGLGFNVVPFWRVPGLGDRVVSIQFLGRFQGKPPSERAVGSLKVLVSTGVQAGRITSDYELYSLREIYDNESFFGDGIHRYARGWNRWSIHLSGPSLLERERKGLLSLVGRASWDKGGSNAESDVSPAEHVIVDDQPGLERCYTLEDCKSRMEITRKSTTGLDNFYVGDDGHSYEGKGWGFRAHLPLKYFNGSSVVIKLIGSHTGETLSLPAIAAFESLLRLGVKLKHLSAEFRIYSLRQAYENVSSVGEGLYQYLKNNGRWAEQIDSTPEADRLPLGLLPIMPRSEWEVEKPVGRDARPTALPIQFVVVGRESYPFMETSQCPQIMQTLQSQHADLYGDIPDNFYLCEDGYAYEGLGWNRMPAWFPEGIDGSALHVSFLSRHLDAAPTTSQLLAFSRLLKHGLKTGKLSEDYKIFTIDRIFGSVPSLSGSFVERVVRTWDGWTDDLSFLTGTERVPSGSFVFATREDWGAAESLHTFEKLTTPARYLIVRNIGDACGNFEECASSMKRLQNQRPPRWLDVPDNFYLGNDGHIFEGRGWIHSSLYYKCGAENDFITVGFLGNNVTYAPTSRSLLALQHLVAAGLRMRMLDPDFRIISLGTVLDASDMVGEKLIEALGGNPRWSRESTLKCDRFNLISLTHPLILRETWKPITQKKYTSLTIPAYYVYVHDGGRRCPTHDSCLQRIIEDSEVGTGANFYVGDSGYVYEGEGWNVELGAPPPPRKTVTVKFFGHYDSYAPLPTVLDSFRRIILEKGLETGKLSQGYKILMPRENESQTLGERFRNELITWK